MRLQRLRWRRKILLLSIGVWLSIVGCKAAFPEPLPGLDTANCDPIIRQDCISVSETFVLNRLACEEQGVRLRIELRALRRTLTTH
jgi:hypothetical protein